MALIPLQTDIEKALTDFIRSEINNNSKGINFSLGFWVNTTDREGKNVEFLQAENNPYQVEEKFIVPMAIDSYAGNITNIEGLFNADYTLPLVFQINVDDPEHFSNSIDAINEFKNNLRGQIKRITVEHNGTSEIFTAVTSTDNLTPQGNLAIMMGETYAFASLTISFDLSKNINYGNQVWIYLSEWDEETGETLPNGNINDFKRIFALSPSFNRVNSPEAFQNFNGKDVVHIIKDTEYSFGMQMFVQDDDLHWNLLQDVINHEVLNKPYLLLLDFKYYDENNVLQTKFKFEEPVVILSAEPSFSIGEPQYLDIAFAKYFTSTEIVSPGIPSLETLSFPLYVTGSKSTGFDNGIFASATFENTDSEAVTLEVSLGTQTKVQQNVQENEQITFTFEGLSHSTNYIFNAIAKKDGFNDSGVTQEAIETYNIVDPELVEYIIGNIRFDGFDFGISNPYDYPVIIYVEYNNNLSTPYLIAGDTQKNFVYNNSNLNDGFLNTFKFIYTTSGQYGAVQTFETPTFDLNIPAKPKVSTPSISNIVASKTSSGGVNVSYDVTNTYSENVDIYSTVSTSSSTSQTINEFVELNVNENGSTGDTVSFSKLYPDESSHGTTVYALAQGKAVDTLNSDVVVSDAIILPVPEQQQRPNFVSSDEGVTVLTTTWSNPNTDLPTQLQVELMDPNNPITVLKTRTANINAGGQASVTFDGLQPDTSYIIRAKLLENGFDLESELFNTTVTTLEPIQTQEPIIKAINIRTTVIDVEITNNASYAIFVEYGLTTSYGNVLTVPANSTEVLFDAITGLSPDTSYTLNAKALNADEAGYTFSNNVTDTFSTPPLTYNITFNANGGTWSDGSTTDKIKIRQEGEVITSSPLGISRSGFNFVGWNPPLPYTVQAFDETLFAGWQEIVPFVVRVRANIGNPAVQIETPNVQFQNTITQTYQVIDDQIDGSSTYSITVNAELEFTQGGDTYTFIQWRLNGTPFAGNERTFNNLNSNSDLEVEYAVNIGPPPF